jgi:hypothetical protein
MIVRGSDMIMRTTSGVSLDAGFGEVFWPM